MSELLLPIFVAFGVTYFSIPAIISIADKKNLFDAPCPRKLHSGNIASLGGLGIFAGFALALLLSTNFSKAIEFQYFVAAALVILFVGVKDDMLSLSPLKKLMGQLIACFFVVHMAGLEINNMFGFFGVYQLPTLAAQLLTYFTMMLIINAFNLIDGVDGLAASIGLIASLVLGGFFLSVGHIPLATVAFSLAGSVSAFLFFNFPPAKIFMGDSGSMLIGLVCSLLIIKFINAAPLSKSVQILAPPAVAIGILIIPLLDTLRVFSVRLLSGKSPFGADRSHVHHILLDKGYSHQKTTLILVAASLFFIVFSFFAQYLGNGWLVAINGSMFFGSLWLLKRGNAWFSSLVLKKFWLKLVTSEKSLIDYQVSRRDTKVETGVY
ncbi:MAG TPA: MraY family glycosyltransferase [Chitinophagaceae bacterium]|nr:MraY family glycosyltransferase [Chitinophagaceae bacterium]